MKSGFVLLMVMLVISYFVLVQKKDRELQQDWDKSVELAKQNDDYCAKGLTPKLVPPPNDWKYRKPRIVLMGTEIPLEDIGKLQFKPGRAGFVVFYRGNQIGACSIE